MKPFFETKLGKLYKTDSTKQLPIEDNSIGLIVTSPPYNLSIDYESSEDSMPFDEYLDWCRLWMINCYDSLAPDGRMCINIPMKITQPHDTQTQVFLVHEYAKLAEQVGLSFYNMTIWDKGNIQKTCWGSFRSASSPFIRDPAECILFFYKDQWKKLERGESEISSKDFVCWTQNVWKFASEKRSRVNHPAPFPAELPSRCIQLLSYKDEVVYDPFMGSGSTAVASEKLGRNWVGTELSEEYCNLSKQRIGNSHIFF